jgi:hypothetical protein
LAVALLCASCLPASASIIYGLSSGDPGTVFTIDPATGAATPVVNLSGGASTSLVGLEFLNGTLYATDIFSNGFVFGSIDLTTGAATTINTQGGSANWHALAADPDADLFYSVDLDNSDTLVSVTPAGVITNIGPAGFAITGLAYDNVNNILYGVDSTSLYTINVATGEATLVGLTGLDDGRTGLAFDNDTATLFLNAGNVGSLYTVNTATGLATLVGPNGASVTDSGIDGLAIAPSSEVPEPGTWALLASGAALVFLKRRRAA